MSEVSFIFSNMLCLAFKFWEEQKDSRHTLNSLYCLGSHNNWKSRRNHHLSSYFITSISLLWVFFCSCVCYFISFGRKHARDLLPLWFWSVWSLLFPSHFLANGHTFFPLNEHIVYTVYIFRMLSIHTSNDSQHDLTTLNSDEVVHFS